MKELRSVAADVRGFTLIEVMISIVLLVMISLAIYQATTQTYRYRAKIINEGDFYAGIRLALGLMDRDISALFSPVIFNPNAKAPGSDAAAGVDQAAADLNRSAQVPGFEQKQASPDAERLDGIIRSDLGKVTDFWLAATDTTAIRPSRFIGTDTKLTFISASHMRLYKNFPESEYAKIIYELRDDKDSSELIESGTKLLVKTEDPNAFEDEKFLKKEKTAKVYPLLPGVKSLKFRYFRRDKKAWETAWDTNRDDMKGMYPDLVEVKIEVKGVSKLSFSGTYMFKPETPFYGLETSF